MIPPFEKDVQLRSLVSATLGRSTRLPGQPRIRLDSPELLKYLLQDLTTPRLNKLSRRLWLVAKQDSSHTSSLTHQQVRGRSIVLTEDPELHLVWIYDRIFIKPMPDYLLSHDIWTTYFDSGDARYEPIIRAAKGFVRSYGHLIKHKSDFHIAQSKDDETHRLIPLGVRYPAFCDFIAAFEKIPDEDVSPRWAFGDLRLTRLNFWGTFFLRQYNFLQVDGQYGAYLARFYGPLAFVFAVLSVSLSAMQVALAVNALDISGLTQEQWRRFIIVCQNFSIFALFAVCGALLWIVLPVAIRALRETSFALTHKRPKSDEVQDVSRMSRLRSDAIKDLEKNPADVDDTDDKAILTNL